MEQRGDRDPHRHFPGHMPDGTAPPEPSQAGPLLLIPGTQLQQDLGRPRREQGMPDAPSKRSAEAAAATTTGVRCLVTKAMITAATKRTRDLASQVRTTDGRG